MKSFARGKNISIAEVQDVSKDGIWLILGDREFFLPFTDYPWFKNATIASIYNVETFHGTQLHWPDLDVDLELESLQNPEQYPLVYH
jgi:hypothetical protein